MPISPHRRSSPKLMLAGNTPRSRPQTARERSFAPASTPAWRDAPRPWSAPSNLSTPAGRNPPPLLTTPAKRPQPPRPPEEVKPSRYLCYAPGQVFLFFHCASGRESGGEGIWVLGVVDESGQKLKRATSKLGEPIRTYPLTIDGANQSVYPWPAPRVGYVHTQPPVTNHTMIYQDGSRPPSAEGQTSSRASRASRRVLSRGIRR